LKPKRALSQTGHEVGIRGAVEDLRPKRLAALNRATLTDWNTDPSERRAKRPKLGRFPALRTVLEVSATCGTARADGRIVLWSSDGFGSPQ
jgi:hypothetical protein